MNMQRTAFIILFAIMAFCLSAQNTVELEALGWKPEATAAYTAWADSFHKLNPNVTVTFNTTNYDEQVRSRLAAGTLPAVLCIPGGNYGFILPKAGVMMDLTNASFISRVMPDILESQRLNGKIYSLPVDLAAEGFIYNKKLFADAGIGVPKTWDQFWSACETFKKKGITPVIVTGGPKSGWSLGVVMFALSVPFVYGPNPAFDANVLKGSDHFTNSSWMKVIDIYSRLLKYVDPDYKELEYTLGLQRMAVGKAAMMIQGTWAVSSIMDYNKDIDLGFFIAPPADSSGKAYMILGSDSTFGVNKKHKDSAWALKFVEFLTTQTAVDEWTNLGHILSAMKGAKADFDPIAMDVQKYVSAKVKAYPITNHMWFLPSVGDNWFQTVQQFNEGQVSANALMNDLEKRLLEGYKQYQNQ